MKIKSEQVYIVEFTEEQWEFIDNLIRNLKMDHLLTLGCKPNYSEKLWKTLLDMRSELYESKK